jgi:hypothetical protein
MTKMHSIGFAIAIAASTALAGCDLYFGNSGNGGDGDRWNYCGSDGYYSCHGDNCEWVGATCPADGGSGSGAPTGSECKASTDCASGCFCDNGTCEEGGFCTMDSDCGDGYSCDVARSSCEPNPTTGCTVNTDCAKGQDCENGTCTATCICENDAAAVQAGYDYCDETRLTCEKGSDPVGDCASTLTCNTTPPLCAEHQVPGIFAGCYTGVCRDISTCEAPAACSAITHEDDCLDRNADCTSVYTGNNCTTSTGAACQSGDSGCTCESFTFNTCTAHSTGQMVFVGGGDATHVVNTSHAR